MPKMEAQGNTLLAAEGEMTVVGQGLEVAENLVRALDASIRDPGNQNSINSELDPTLVLDLLDALPSALSLAASGASAALVNARLARRDSLLSSSSFPKEVKEQLRLCPLESKALFGPDLKEARDRVYSQEPPLSSSSLVDAFAKAFTKHSASVAGPAKVQVKNRKRQPSNSAQPDAGSTSGQQRGRWSRRSRGRGRGRGRGQSQPRQQSSGN
jgi:hypothetical protein